MRTIRYFQVFIRLRSKTSGEWLAPPEIRECLVTDALLAESNLTHVVLRILADRYGVPYDPGQRRTAPNVLAEELNLRVPMRLYRKVAASASKHPRTVQREIIECLCDHYAIERTAA